MQRTNSKSARAEQERIAGVEASRHRHYSLLFSVDQYGNVHAVVGRMDPSTRKYSFIRLGTFTVDADTADHVGCLTSAISTEIHQDREASLW